MCALFPMGSGTKKPIIVNGTMAIIGRSHILNLTGIATLLIEVLNENKEKIIKKISTFIIMSKIEANATGIIGFKTTFNKIKIKGPVMR